MAFSMMFVGGQNGFRSILLAVVFEQASRRQTQRCPPIDSIQSKFGLLQGVVSQDTTVLVSANERWKAGVYPTDFLDATGGGDAFDAGFICGLLQKADAKHCLELGSALGASCVRKSGATAGVFTAAEADAFIRSHQLSVAPIP